MVQKSILVAVILLLFYSLLFNAFPVKMTQDMQFANISRAQNYVYNYSTKSIIIVGSSLSERIITDSLPDAGSLAFSGLSIFDGLKVIQAKNKYPKTIIIELNVLEKSENKNFTDYFYNPVLKFINSRLSFTRADARPVGYAIKTINYFQKKIHSNSVSANKNNKVISIKSDNKWLKEELLRNQQSEYNSMEDSAKIMGNIANLKKEVSLLMNKGVNIVFLQMPVDKSLISLKRPAFINKQIMLAFPETEFKFILPDHFNYETNDGIHLDENSALIYTKYIEKQLFEFNF